MEILYLDEKIIVCVKPAGVLSTDEAGGLPELIRQELGSNCEDVRTVHRLDRVVSGLMLLARDAESAAELSRQIREDSFDKEYLAVTHGITPEEGNFTDLMRRDKAERKSYVTDSMAKGVQEARLRYRRLAQADGLSLVRVQLLTGRTHQIRCQFSHHGFPLVGDRKYSILEDGCDIALLSAALGFAHPSTGERMEFRLSPPEQWPWNIFIQ